MRKKKDEMEYFITYPGWGPKFNTWVNEFLILKRTDESKRHANANDLEFHCKLAGPNFVKRKKGKKSGLKVNTPVIVEEGEVVEPTPKEYQVGKYFDSEAEYRAKVEVKIVIPDALKIVLLEDFQMITRMKKLVIIPAERTVHSILDDYQKFVKENNEDEELAADLCVGIKEYFQRMLDCYPLLYPLEQDQLEWLAEKYEKDGTEPDLNATYGAPHLLRLFTKLGGCLAYTDLQPDSIEILCKGIRSLLSFLEANREIYFTPDNYYSVAKKRERTLSTTQSDNVDITTNGDESVSTSTTTADSKSNDTTTENDITTESDMTATENGPTTSENNDPLAIPLEIVCGLANDDDVVEPMSE